MVTIVLGVSGFCLEVGPVPQGAADPVLEAAEEALLLDILAFVDRWNKGEDVGVPQPVKVYKYVGTHSYYEGGQIHPDRMNKNYQPVIKGDPMFLDKNGNTLSWEADDTVYPIFIDEEAYKELDDSMELTHLSVEIW